MAPCRVSVIAVARSAIGKRTMRKGLIQFARAPHDYHEFFLVLRMIGKD